MDVNFSELKEVIKERLEGQCNLNDFDKFWDIRINQKDNALYQWMGEAFLNNYLKWLEIGENISNIK